MYVSIFRSRTACAILAAVLSVAGFTSRAQAACSLNSASGKIKHVLYMEFDNVHFTRDNPNVPSDLEQMPNLLNFITQNGTLDAADHAVLISHTANDILTTQLGLYSDRDGIAVANSFGVFGPQTSKTPNGVYFPSSFFYWTDLVSDINTSSGDPLFALLNENQENISAPWVPFTRAGCDVGAFSTANIVLERAPFDVQKVFGTTFGEDSNHQNADFTGEAIHCAIGSSLCTTANGAVADSLPSEPGGYSGYSALFGAKFLQNAMGGPFQDLELNTLTNSSSGLVGFPGFNPLATQTLGAVATMFEHNVPVVFAYISDAHDDHVNNVAFGPGQAGYVAQLASYNQAFGKFFARLKADGIDQSNTLFVFTPDEGDHFVGGAPRPAGCDGVNVPCTYATIGEQEVNLAGLVANAYGASIPPSFDIHTDDAPTIYVKGQPGPTDPSVRQLEQVIATVTVPNQITGHTDLITAALADPVEEKLLHMVTADPARTPTFTLFGDPDYFFLTSGSTTPVVSPGFAWNHGDIQLEIARTFIGIVGPGVRKLGVVTTGNGLSKNLFTDHVDVRPTIMDLVGLSDDYEHDGRVILEVINESAQHQSEKQHRDTLLQLGQIYKQINAPFGQLAHDSLIVSTAALASTAAGDSTYSSLEGEIAGWTTQRDQLAVQMKALLEGASFNGQPINEGQAKSLIDQGQALLDQTAGAAASL